MKKWSVLFLFKFFLLSSAFALQDIPSIFKDRDYTLTGVVKNQSGIPLTDATIWIEELQKGLTSDVNGFFSFALKTGKYTLKASFIGYTTAFLEVNINQNTTIIIRLEESLELLNTVEIIGGGADKNVKNAELGVSRLGAQAIRELPSLLGEADVIRTIQTLPGITSVGESATGFNVRGGNIDQNLLLLDHIPIFNPSHLIGFFSIFNPDLLRDITFYRGGIPAQYGGRASSVLDVRLRDPNNENSHLKGSLGLITSRLLFEAPLIKNKLSYALGARWSYADYLFRSFLRPELKETEANFYDLTFKSIFKPSEKDQISFTAFTGKDAFRIAGDSLSTLEINASSTRYLWKSNGASIRWSHFINENAGFHLTSFFSDYQPSFEIPSPGSEAIFKAGISQKSLQGEGFLTKKDISVRFGFQVSNLKVNPGSLLPNASTSSINPFFTQKESGLESALFTHTDWDLSPAIRFSAGIRFSHFALLGPGNQYIYVNEKERDILNLIDTSFFSANQIIKQYAGWEPRLGLRVSLNEVLSIKAGFHRALQYLHLISNSTAALPTDRWKLSDAYIKPQIASQLTLGLFANVNNNQWETSLEGYYKRIQNMPDYRSGTNLLLLEYPETAILQGLGRSYGLELWVRKQSFRWDANLSYSLSRSEILVHSPYPEDRAFSGKYYPSNYNRPHTVNLNVLYRINKRIRFSAIFTYLSGRPATFPEERISVNNIFIPLYTSRNGNTTPDYHRLDLGLIIDADPRITKKWKGKWNFSLYNVYARKNPYSVFFKTINDRPVSTRNRSNAFQLSVIGSVIPSISYEFEY
jgi:hypothetical protein